MTWLLSFDIDGTLEIGDPPGPIPLAAVHRALELGFVVGSCSDRPLKQQEALWQRHEVPVHFSVLKQHLGTVRSQFPAENFMHIGDSLVDQQMAEGAAFDFVHVVHGDYQEAFRAIGIRLTGPGPGALS